MAEEIGICDIPFAHIPVKSRDASPITRSVSTNGLWYCGDLSPLTAREKLVKMSGYGKTCLPAFPNGNFHGG